MMNKNRSGQNWKLCPLQFDGWLSRHSGLFNAKNILKKFQISSKPIVPPEIKVKEAAVLFADISGFTVLTEKMSKLGALGIERITSHLNNFFDQLIQKIHLYGGDIIKFAGDALLAVWAEDILHDKLPKLVNLACQCALDIQMSLHNYLVEECVLRLHIGLGAGKISFVHVGGEDNTLEFLITGHRLYQVSQNFFYISHFLRVTFL